jgi:DMSO reductase anchor subunit
VFLFSTAVVLGCALFQRFDQVIGQIADDQLGHAHAPLLVLSMIATLLSAAQSLIANQGTRNRRESERQLSEDLLEGALRG